MSISMVPGEGFVVEECKTKVVASFFHEAIGVRMCHLSEEDKTIVFEILVEHKGAWSVIDSYDKFVMEDMIHLSNIIQWAQYWLVGRHVKVCECGSSTRQLSNGHWACTKCLTEYKTTFDEGEPEYWINRVGDNNWEHVNESQKPV